MEVREKTPSQLGLPQPETKIRRKRRKEKHRRGCTEAKCDRRGKHPDGRHV